MSGGNPTHSHGLVFVCVHVPTNAGKVAMQFTLCLEDIGKGQTGLFYNLGLAKAVAWFCKGACIKTGIVTWWCSLITATKNMMNEQ